jgi:hypothetical protein
MAAAGVKRSFSWNWWKVWLRMVVHGARLRTPHLCREKKVALCMIRKPEGKTKN